MSPVFNSRILFLIFIVLIILIIFAFYFLRNSIYKIVFSDKEALLIIDDGKKERWFKGEVVKGMTVADVLSVSALAGGFEFSINGKLVELGGLSDNKENQWRCFINNVEIKENLDEKEVSPKDKIVCKYYNK